MSGASQCRLSVINLVLAYQDRKPYMNACTDRVSTERTSKDRKKLNKITRNNWRYEVLPCLCNTKLGDNRKKIKSFLFVLLGFIDMTKLCLIISKRCHTFCFLSCFGVFFLSKVFSLERRL